MEEVLRQRLTSRGIWSRALYMVLFAIAYTITETIIFFLVVFQFLVTLLTGSANEPLLRFGTNLSTYVYQILQFQTFNTETHPFPFSDWPNEDARGDRWRASEPRDEADQAGVETTDEPEVIVEPHTPSDDESATRDS